MEQTSAEQMDLKEGESLLIPPYLLTWLRNLKPVDTACNAHKISDALWSDLREKAANIWYESTPDDKNKYLTTGHISMTPDEMFKEQVDEDREIWRIVGAMCVAERTKGRENFPPISLCGPNGVVQSWFVDSESGSLKPMIKKCTVCSAACDLKCSRCKMFYYCSKEHQKKHWLDGHKHKCAPFVKA